MLQLFTDLADWVTYSLLALTPSSKLASGVHFFVEDTSKILLLLLLLIYLIALVRASLDAERVRAYLSGKNRFSGYALGSIFGAITPFCSCSSIPLFMGFVSARIPLGVTMAFLLTSPMINEVAVILLWSLLGLKFTLIYITVGFVVGITGGYLIDQMKAERWLAPFLVKQYQQTTASPVISQQAQRLTLKQRHTFAKKEMLDIFQRIWLWVILGVSVGAFIHGYIPQDWFQQNLGDGQWWSIPLATIVAIPMYVNATSIIPILETLLLKGVPVGTTLAFCMSAVAVSLPELMMLKQVMQNKLLLTIIFYLITAFCLVGWLFNAINLI